MTDMNEMQARGDTRQAPVDSTLLPGHLVDGYEAFLDGHFHREHERYRRLAERGQRPPTLLIGCSDSRVSPEIIFDAHPGEIFVVRNVANLVPPFDATHDSHGTLAALEFAVQRLGVEHIVIMGHSLCGGVRAFAEHHRDPSKRPLSSGDFIGRWMEIISPAAKALGGDDQPIEIYADRLGKASVIETLANLRSYAYVAEKERSGALALHGAYFDTADGRLFGLDAASGQFIPMAQEAHARSLAEPRF